MPIAYVLFMPRTTLQRLSRVVAGLKPPTHLVRHHGGPCTLRERMEFHRAPGVSIAVIHNRSIEWSRGFGLRDARKKGRVTNNTLFQAASISKPITALAVMRLVQDGRLDLDEDVNHYLRSWKVPPNGRWQPRVTLRQILSHSAGLTTHGFPGYSMGEPLPTVPQILDGLFPANTMPVRVNLLPGVQFRYSGGGTTVIQQLLIDQLRQPFPELMRELVLTPFGMRDSTYEQPAPRVLTARMAVAHPSKGIPLPGRHHVYPEMAAAGLWTTAGDLARVGAEMLRVIAGEPPTSGIAQATMQAMLAPQLPGQHPGGQYLGLGFMCWGTGRDRTFGHDGWNEGFVARMRLFPESGCGVVIMVNSNQGGALLDEVGQAAITEYHGKIKSKTELEAHSTRGLSAFCGNYTSASGQKICVARRADALTLTYAAQPAFPLVAISASEFVANAVNVSVRFEKAKRTLVLTQDGQQVTAQKANG